jgi:cation:H+ antiporter
MDPFYSELVVLKNRFRGIVVWIGLLGTIFGLFLLIWGSNLLIDGAAGLAKKKGISGHVIGLTLVATATSLPELATAISATISGSHDIALGNVVGSNAFNVGIVLAIGVMILPIFPERAARRDGLIVLGATCVFAVFAVLSSSGIGRVEAGVLLVLYLGYVFYLFKTTKFIGEVEVGEKSTVLLSLMLVLGSIILFVGSVILVPSAERLASAWGVGNSIIAVTLIAAGTSLPELVTGVTAAIKGHEGIAVGNVLGSNLFNILLIPGIAALIHPLEMDSLLSKSLIPAMLLLTALTVALSYRKMGKLQGFMLLAGFILFMTLTLQAAIV